MNGTQNFYNGALDDMEKQNDIRVKKTGDRIPYHLEYIRKYKQQLNEKQKGEKL